MSAYHLRDFINRTRRMCDGYDQERIFDRLASDQLVEQLATVQDRHTGERKLDSQSMLYAVRQLEFVMAETYEEDFPELRMAMGDMVPINSSVPEGAESFTYYLYSATGVARFSSAYTARTAPRVYAEGAKVTGNIEGMEAGYAYAMRDIRAAQFAGDNLDQRLASADRRAHEELLNETGLWGREDLGLPGLINHPNITIIDAADVGTLPDGRDWRGKTNDQILTDIADGVDTVNEVTFGLRNVNRVEFSRRAMNLLKRRRLGSGDGLLSLLDFIKDNYDGSDGTPPIDFRTLNELDFRQSDGNLIDDAMFCYVAGDKRLIELIQPMPYRQHPVQQDGLEIKVPSESSTGGIKMPEPQVCVRVDGVFVGA